MEEGSEPEWNLLEFDEDDYEDKYEDSIIDSINEQVLGQIGYTTGPTCVLFMQENSEWRTRIVS